MSAAPIPFNRPYVSGRELAYIEEAIAGGHLAGNGPFTDRCVRWLRERTGADRALLTTSGTAALELAMLLAGVGAGDEVAMPSFSFVSTANAAVLRGATPVFVDVRADTLNVDAETVEAGLTPRTRAIVPVHYGGVACDMDSLLALAAERDLVVIEDAAQGTMARYRDRALGGVGDVGALSFHETKNLGCGEGGALLVNRSEWSDRSEVLHDKGTDRARFFRGEVDSYTWMDVGSSYLPSEIAAAFLWAQLERAEEVTRRRVEIWDRYHAGFSGLEAKGRARRPVVPAAATHNGHMYYLLLEGAQARDRLLVDLAARGVTATFHYLPLHRSAGGRRHGRAAGPLPRTVEASERIVRLPLWFGMRDADVDRVIAAVLDALAR